MTSAITIRDAGKGDIATICKIYAHAVEFGTASFELEAPDADEMLRRFTAIKQGGYPYLVAFQNGVLKGYAYASAFRPRPAYRWSVESTVYVAPDAQGAGIGRTLMTQLIDICQRDGFRQMIAIVGGADHQASIGLHVALGFVQVGRSIGVGWKHGKWHDTVMLQMALGEGKSTPPEE